MCRKTKDKLWWLLGVVFLASAGCATPWDDASDVPTLYQELGRMEGIERLNETLILTIARDDRISHFFRGVDIARFHRMLSEHLCELSGGPCQYNGDSLRLVHAGMGVDNAAFNALVEDLILAMETQGLATGTQNRLLKRLAALHPEVVNVPLPDSISAGTDMEQIDRPGVKE
jgi:hemoglobin